MLIITDINYLLSQKVPATIFSEEEKAVVYYEETDTIPAKAFSWLSELNGKIVLVPYADIGGVDNLSFAAGVYAGAAKTKSAVIVGQYDKAERVIRTGQIEYRVFTTTDFKEIPGLGAKVAPNPKGELPE